MSEIKTVEFYYTNPETEEEEEITINLPACWEVCSCCNGRGKTYLGFHAYEQPAFTQEDMDYEGDDFRQDYMTGRYDKTCPECKGRTTILEIEWDKLDKSDPQISAYLEYIEEEDYSDAEREAERRFGC